MRLLAEPARAKVNLYLHITGRRDDGYHLLDSLAVFPDAADQLTAEPDSELRLSVSGPFAAGLRGDDDGNLVLRAARALAPYRAKGDSTGAHLILDKHLPVASGIGGGSADAAAALRLLRRLWSIETIDDAALHALAYGLGADVPVCLMQRPARMRGVGEILQAAPGLPEIGMMLVNCGAAVSTQAVFRARGAGFTQAADLPQGWRDASALGATLASLRNDLETAAIGLCPEIGDALAALRALPGCRFARMSGSGATCFALFDDPPLALAAAGTARLPPHWWRWAGGMTRND